MSLQTLKDVASLVAIGPPVTGILQLMECERIINKLLKDNILDLDIWEEERHQTVNKARKIALNIKTQLRELQFAIDGICTESIKKINKQ